MELTGLQAQTPQQRKANQKFAKDLNKKMGKTTQEVKKKQEVKSPVPMWALGAFPPPPRTLDAVAVRRE